LTHINVRLRRHNIVSDRQFSTLGDEQKAGSIRMSAAAGSGAGAIAGRAGQGGCFPFMQPVDLSQRPQSALN
jgi:hypothetical protein